MKKQQTVFAYLFGSQATGKVGKLSDVDLAVYLRKCPSSFDVQLKLMGELGTILREDRVDVVVLNEASPLLAQMAIVHGKVIFDQDPATRLDFEKRNLQIFEDMSYFRNVYFEALKERVIVNKMGEYYERPGH